MKQAIIISIFVMLIAGAYAATDNVAVVPNVKVRDESTYNLRNPGVLLINQMPDPVEPGDIVEVRFKVENIGRETARNVVFEILPEYPFSLQPGQPATVSLGNLNVNSFGENAVIVYYKLRVDPAATPGNNSIQFRYSINGGTSWILPEKFYIRVQHTDSTLSISQVNTQPTEILPGEDAKVSITLENMAATFLKNIALRLDLSFSTLDDLMGTSATAASQSELLQLPFAPLNSATEKSIKLLEGSSKHTFTYDIIAYPSAQAGIYKVPIQVKYLDELNNQYVINDVITLMVKPAPILSLRLDSSDIKTAGQKGSVVVSFVNKGKSNILFVDSELQDSEQFELLSAKEMYIGNIDSDDYETVEYEIRLNSDVSDHFTLPIKVSYEDELGQELSATHNVKVRVYSSEESKDLGINGEKSVSPVVITIIIVVAGILLYLIIKKVRSRKKK